MMNSSRRNFLKVATTILGSATLGLKIKSDYIPASDTGLYNCHIQAIKVSANLGREQIYELGRKRPYYKFLEFPVNG